MEFHEWLDFFKTLGKNTKKYEELPEFLKTYLHLFFLCSDANSTYHLFRAIICPFTTLGSILSSQFNFSSPFSPSRRHNLLAIFCLLSPLCKLISAEANGDSSRR